MTECLDDESYKTNIEQLEESTEKLLYDGSNLTVQASDETMTDVLHLIKLHCPTPNNCISSLYHFKKQFSHMQYPIVISHFCSSCLNVLTPNDIND